MIFMWVIAETTAKTTLEMLTRRCPKCGRKQVVPKEKLKTGVRCVRCGARVPPAAELNRRHS
jgi:ribosomal protein L40E